MRRVIIAIPLLALAIVSCAEQRAKWAAAHAEIHASPPLSHSDVLEIARLISHATTDPIIAIDRTSSVRRRERVIVVCRLAYGGATAYTVEKAGPSWHILTESD